MKKYIRNILLLIFPFLLMVGVNEIVRPVIKKKPYASHGITAINSADKIQDKCTWICHNQTSYCKKYHVKFARDFFPVTDKIYFGVISLLRSTGNYGMANIIFLVVLIPFTMWFLLIQSIIIQEKINDIKRGK